MKNLSKKALIEEFHEFLRENNCASKFYANTTKANPKEKVETFIRKCTSDKLLGGAFSWRQSPEKFPYWSDIQRKWDERLKAIEYNFKKSKSK